MENKKTVPAKIKMKAKSKVRAPKLAPKVVKKTKAVSRKTDSVATRGEIFSIEESLRVGWKLFSEKPWLLIGITIIPFLVDSAIRVGQLFLTDGSLMVGYVFLEILAFAIGIVLGLGIAKIMLDMYDNKSVELGDLFKQIDKFWIFLGVIIIAQLIILGGMMFFIIPGIIAAIAFMFIQMLIVDKKIGVMEAIRTSWAMTDGQKGQIFVLGLVLLGVNLLGLLALGVGLLVTIPVSYLAMTYVYRKLLSNANIQKKLPVEKLQTVPKVFLWTGAIVIPVLIVLTIGMAIITIMMGMTEGA
jgi:uncharacterized membrane protein